MTPPTSTQLLHVASSRPVGRACVAWAEANLPAGWALTDDPEACDVFVSCMYGSLVSEEFINRPGRRCYNFHPGILPEYRGSGAFSWAIVNGERRCGVTLHELDVNIDTGPVIDVGAFPIEAWDTAESLFDKGMVRLVAMFKGWLPRLLANDHPRVPQDEGRARTYYRKDLAGKMDLTRFVRAFTFGGKPGAFYVDRTGRKVDLTW